MLGANLQNLVATATCFLGFVHPCFCFGLGYSCAPVW